MPRTPEGYRPDRMRVLFGGFSAGGFGTLYNYHYVLDDLQWAHTAAYPDAAWRSTTASCSASRPRRALISDTPPLGWGARAYLPPYCFATNCGVGPVLLAATSPRLKAVPEQQILVLSNQVDDTQVGTTFFPTTADLDQRACAQSYCETRGLHGVHYFLPAITAEHARHQSTREELYTAAGRRHHHARLAGRGDHVTEFSRRRRRGRHAGHRLSGRQRLPLRHQLTQGGGGAAPPPLSGTAGGPPAIRF